MQGRGWGRGGILWTEFGRQPTGSGPHKSIDAFLDKRPPHHLDLQTLDTGTRETAIATSDTAANT